MTNTEKKAKELGLKYFPDELNVFARTNVDAYKTEYACLEMAEWKDQQMMELWNVARNIYEAWMGGTMNDVRECMKDLGHMYDEFKDKGMY